MGTRRHNPQTVTPRLNRVAIGQTLAVLFCPASNGKVFAVTIDLADLPRVQTAGRWHVANFDAANGRINLYAHLTTKINGRTVYLHRFLLNAPKGIEVDHSHHRNLDNRKAEIRLATKSENQRNQKPRNSERQRLKERRLKMVAA